MPQPKPSAFVFCIAFLTLLLHAGEASSQVSGCTDPTASNYNPAATVNNGSCAYNTTYYTPPVKINPLSATFNEISGLEMTDDGFLWGHNDGGGAAAVYRFDTVNGSVLQTVTLDGATNVDWEDMAFDGTHFYVGDFGNNANGARTDLKIYKFPLSAVPDNYTAFPAVTVPAAQIDVINFSYADQGIPVPVSANNTKWDCEAMAVTGGQVHLFTKNWVDANTTHYVIPTTAAGTYTLTPLETLASGYLVTAVDVTPNGATVALLGYANGGFYDHFMHLLTGFSGGFFFNGNKRLLNLPNVFTMGQAEAVAFVNNRYGYIANERVDALNVTPKLRSFFSEGFVPPAVLPVGLLRFDVRKQPNGDHHLSWAFAETVSNLRILYGSGARTAVHTEAVSRNGSYVHKPDEPKGCYTLQWNGPSGALRFSNVVCLDASVGKGLYGLVLTGGGEFRFNAAENDVYAFRFLGTDGRLLWQTADNRVVAGSNAIQVKAGLPTTPLLIVQAIGTKGQTTKRLMVSR